MTAALVRFEWRYHTRQVSFAGACALFLLFGFVLSATGFGPANVQINSPYSVMESIGLLSLLSVFVLAIFSATAIVRDRDHRMEEIVFSTAVEKRDFLVSRFGGAFLAATSAFTLSIAGMVIGTLLPSHDPARIASFDAIRYLWALVVMGVPNILLATVLLFAIAALTRSLLASSVGAVLIYVLYFAASAWTNSPLMASSVPGTQESVTLAALLDPFGLSAFFDQTRAWMPAERNERLLELSGLFLANRALWLTVSALCWGVVYRSFSFRTRKSPSRIPRSHPPDHPARNDGDRTSYGPSAIDSSRRAALRAFYATFRMETRTWLRSLPFLALTLLWAALAMSEVSASISNGEYGSALYPTTGLVMSAMLQPLQLIGLVILVYASTEMAWRERTIGMDGIVHATPTSSASFILGKWSALAALVAVLVAVSCLVAIVFQATHGNSAIDWSAMAAFAWVAAAPLVVFATLALLVHTVTPHKYLGLLIVLLFAVLQLGGSLFGLENRLLRFASTPEVAWSDFYGFGPFARPFNIYVLHWSLVGALFLWLAARYWRSGLTLRSGGMRASVTFVGLLLAVLVSTAYIVVNTMVVRPYITSASLRNWKIDYERNWKRFETIPKPSISRIDANVALFPEAQKYRVRGSYALTNHSQHPISEVLVSVRRDARSVRLEFPDAELASRDDRFGHHLYRLATPLAPGGSARLGFDLEYWQPGFSDSGPDTAIVENGSFIRNTRAFPQLGYRRSYELTNPAERRRAGLPVAAVTSEGDEAEYPDEPWLAMNLTVSTRADQIPVTSGTLQREWIQSGRRYRRYVAGRMPPWFVITSGRYRTITAKHRDVDVSLHYIDAHATSAPRILAAALDSLRLFEESFGRYPYRQLKLVETPDPGNTFGGFAQPDTIFLNENRTFLVDPRDPQRLDLVTRRVAHEVAHQWWGNSLSPPDGAGATFVVESLTKYAELLMLERKYGRDALRQSRIFELDAYLEGRTEDDEAEKPLVRANREPYLYYRKGAVVLSALRELLGEERLHGALREFYAEGSGPRRSPRASQFLAKLKASASPEEQTLIDEWMQQITLYDFAVESVSVKETGGGRFRVTLHISARKEDERGAELPMSEEIEFGLFADDPDRGGAENVIHAAKHQIESGATVIELITTRRPEYAAIDPWITRIDRNRFDNGKRVE